MKIKKPSGNKMSYLVEVKPKVFCKKPNAPKINNKKKIESYKKSMKTYRQNLSKWKFAKIWAINRGWLFTIVTEDFFKTTSYK
jgi:hypothetical protein